MRDVPVLIAGGGPVGMTLAHDLARRGVRCMLVERNGATTSHPKMDITNARSMEIFRRLGLVQALRAAAVGEDHVFDVSWVTSMAGQELWRFRYPSVTERRRRIRSRNDGSEPAEPPMRVSQVEIEPVLKRAIDAAPDVEVRFGVALEDLSQDRDGVTATLRLQDGSIEQVRCRYLVGCDGGTSQVRQVLGIALAGRSRIMPRFMTHFRSDAREVLQRWGMAWHYQSPLGTLIAQNDRDLWTLHSRAPDDSELASFDPATLLRSFLGTEIPYRVEVANRWSPHLLVADAYQAGRVFLAGDAAHQYIPTGGYGMNTGIGDAFDLGWKLTAVLRGFAGPALLDSYDAERRPVGLRNCDGAQRHNETRVRIAQLYREAGVHGAASPDADALARLSAAIGIQGNAENESFGLELGYSYVSDAVCRDPEQQAPADPLRYQPSTVPGVRLPSMLLPDGSLLYDRLGDWFTLLAIGVPPCPAIIVEAARLGVPLDVLACDDATSLQVFGRQQLLVRPDHHIGWRGQSCDADQAGTILRQVTGRAPQGRQPVPAMLAASA